MVKEEKHEYNVWRHDTKSVTKIKIEQNMQLKIEKSSNFRDALGKIFFKIILRDAGWCLWWRGWGAGLCTVWSGSSDSVPAASCSQSEGGQDVLLTGGALVARRRAEVRLSVGADVVVVVIVVVVQRVQQRG